MSDENSLNQTWCYVSSELTHIYVQTRLLPFGSLDRIYTSLWLNIAKNEVYWCYRYYSKLFGKMRKETEFRQQSCRNCKKKYNVSGERENWISVMRLPKFLSYPSSAHEVPQVHARGSAQKRKQLWQPSCWNCRDKKRENMNCGNQVPENGRKKKKRIVTTKLPKMKEKKCYVHNIFTSFSQQITGG